jgi:predicted porin
MKKHLIAAAVAGALAVPAMAQVTVSGVVDLGYQSFERAGTGAAAGKKVRTSAVGDNMVATPTLAITGSEDLGGGLKAGFSIVQEFQADNGVKSTDKDYTYVTVNVQGGFGNVSLGRMNHATRDLGGIYRFFGDIGRLPGTFNSSAAQTNTIQYQSPSIGGFTASVGMSDAGKTTADVDSASLTTYGLRGKIAGLNVGISQEDSEAAAGGAKTKLTTIGGSYDLGAAKVGLVYVNKNPDGDNNNTKGYSVNLAVPLSGFTVGGSYASFESDAADEAKVMTLALEYPLSKRTSVFGSYQSIDSDGAGAGISSTRGLPLAEVPGDKSNGYGISVVHKF